jgi:hypothetical protein
LRAAYQEGLRAVAILMMHAWAYPAHEERLGAIAREVGFTQISLSHRASPLPRIVPRGDTTVVDAYLSPILRRYVDQVAAELPSVRLYFMQSSGGLTEAGHFQGKDAILSGPAGGIVGAARTAAMGGFERIIGFDMGGTSTDVALYAGAFERAFETEVAGVRMRAPMMAINTVAAGGGSILHFDGARFRVGPDSAGAVPGPACYRRGGPLTVTHPDMRRYFMTVREAVGLVLQASVVGTTDAKDQPPELAEGGIFVLDMGQPVKIVDLARRMIRLAGLRPDEDVEIRFTGLRPGERLYEELFHGQEPPRPTAFPGLLVATPRTADSALVGRAIDEMAAAGRAGNARLALQQLARLVPEFAHAPEGTAAAGPR